MNYNKFQTNSKFTIQFDWTIILYLFREKMKKNKRENLNAWESSWKKLYNFKQY